MEWIKSAERKLFFPFTAERVVKKAILPNWFCMAGNVLWHCDYANIVRRLLTPTPSKDEHFVISPDVGDNYCNATVMPWSRRLDINCMLVKSHSWRGRRRKFDGSVTEAELIGPKKRCQLLNQYCAALLPSSFMTSTLDGKTSSDKCSFIWVSVKALRFIKDTYPNKFMQTKRKKPTNDVSEGSLTNADRAFRSKSIRKWLKKIV